MKKLNSSNLIGDDLCAKATTIGVKVDLHKIVGFCVKAKEAVELAEHMLA